MGARSITSVRVDSVVDAVGVLIGRCVDSLVLAMQWREREQPESPCTSFSQSELLLPTQRKIAPFLPTLTCWENTVLIGRSYSLA